MNRLQSVELDILKEIDRICKKYGIEYSLSGGSVLGAVRHNGFIPWDDDIDLNMTRKEYERFLEVAPTELKYPYALHTYKNNIEHHYYFSHVVNTEYSVRRLGSADKRVENVWVDVYPLDGMPNNSLVRDFHYLKLQILRMFYHMGYFEKVNVARPDRPKYQMTIIKIYQIVNRTIKFNGPKWREKLDKELKKYKTSDSVFLMNFIGMYGKKEIFPKTVLYPTKKYTFESIEVPGPFDYEKYLSQLYGDWRKPPKNKDTHPLELLFEETKK